MSEYRSEYEGKCGNCQEYEYAGKYTKGYCNWYKTYYHADDSCSHQKNIPWKSSGGCYITTIICQKLGLEDDCAVLNSLRNLRDNVMQKNEKYFGLLYEYDTVGPQIANMISEDQETEQELWISIYNFYLSPTATFMNENQPEQAINRYQEMVGSLKEYYGIREDIKEIPKDYDIKQAGHGKVKTLTPAKGEI